MLEFLILSIIIPGIFIFILKNVLKIWWIPKIFKGNLCQYVPVGINVIQFDGYRWELHNLAAKPNNFQLFLSNKSFGFEPFDEIIVMIKLGMLQSFILDRKNLLQLFYDGIEASETGIDIEKDRKEKFLKVFALPRDPLVLYPAIIISDEEGRCRNADVYTVISTKNGQESQIAPIKKVSILDKIYIGIVKFLAKKHKWIDKIFV